jgi:LuxR family maltose regulon positive regulatory protein
VDYGEEQPEVLKASTALAALVCGDRAPALRWAQAETGPVRASALAVAQLPLVRAEILLAGNSEDVQTAVSLLTSHLAYVHNLQLAGEAVQTAILLARACWQAQRQADALRALDEAVTIGYARGYRWSFHRHGTVMQEMLQALRHRFCDVGAIDALLHAFPPAAETPAAAEAPATPLVRPSVMLYVDLLTTRELQVLRLLAQDLTNKEIAKVLSVSTFTVRNHTVNIYQKLEVASRRQAILRAAELGLLQEAGSTAA